MLDNIFIVFAISMGAAGGGWANEGARACTCN